MYEIDTCKYEEVIISTLKKRGDGTKTSPIRVITQVFTKEGELIAEVDPLYNSDDGIDEKIMNMMYKNMIEFTLHCMKEKLKPHEITNGMVINWIHDKSIKTNKS